MIKSSPTKETDNATQELVKSTLVRHTVQFYNKGGDGKLKPFASGVLLKTHDQHFILTASHVADYFEKEENDLFIQVDHKSYINVFGDIKYSDINRSKGIDIAYIKIASEMLVPMSKPYIFLTIDQVRNHNKRLDAMNYCVVGFPENNVKREEGKMRTGADFYLTGALNEKAYEYYSFDPKDFFLLEMKGKGTDIKTGEKTKVNTHFYGISGCGLWYLMYNVNPATNMVSIDYRLIGIMTEFKKGKFFCLVANKIHLIIEAFKVIEKLKYKEAKVN
jgi:hypothetical protein